MEVRGQGLQPKLKHHQQVKTFPFDGSVSSGYAAIALDIVIQTLHRYKSVAKSIIDGKPTACCMACLKCHDTENQKKPHKLSCFYVLLYL